MSFRLVPNSVTLNDLGRRNDPYFALFHRIHFRGPLRKTGYRYPKHLSLAIYHLWRYSRMLARTSANVRYCSIARLAALKFLQNLRRDEIR